MLVDTPENPQPTPPPTERPLPTAPTTGLFGAAPPQYAPPPDDPAEGALDEVHRAWSAALGDEGGPDQGQQAAGPAPTPFGDDLRTGAAVGQWKPAAERISQAAGVPPDVTLALIHSVSGGDPGAKLAGGQAVGLAGVPLARFAPGQDPSDPATNLGVALGQLKTAYQRTGDWTKAALAATGYGDQNGEPRVVGNGVDGFSWQDKFNAARRRYGGQ